MVLISSLTVLSVLVVIGIGVGVMLQNDFRVLTNLRSSTESFYFSVAGLEWGKSEIARTSTFPPVLQSRSQTFASGEFTVAFQSPSVIAPLAAQIIIRATGISHGAHHVLQAQLTKSYDLADAAVGLRGNGAAVNFNAEAIFISGADHDVATGNAVVGAKSRSAISTADESLFGLVTQAAGARQGILDGSADTPAVAQSVYLPADFVSRLADDLCAAGSATLHSVPTSGGLTIENQTWGSRALPQLHCIEGLSGTGDTVTLAGNLAGVGIRVVRNADLILNGAFRWEGLVLVTGTDVSLQMTGSSTNELLGAAIVNESGIPVTTKCILAIEGASRILFSRQALSRASSLIPAATVNNAYGSLPSVILQDSNLQYGRKMLNYGSTKLWRPKRTGSDRLVTAVFETSCLFLRAG
jgi:hypothetical protein